MLDNKATQTWLDENEDDGWTLLLRATIAMIADRYWISYNQAEKLFKKSQIYHILSEAPDDPYYGHRYEPELLFEEWINERILGVPIDNSELAYGALKGRELD